MKSNPQFEPKDTLQYTKCFGGDANRYVTVVRTALARTASQSYSFMPLDKFKSHVCSPNGLARLNQIYWTEMLHRAHLASCTSLRRNLGWIEAVCMSYAQVNYLGFSASLRGFVESVGDSADVLLHMPENIARDHKMIKRCIDGNEASRAVAARDMEDELIGYSHARHVHKKEEVPRSHKAKQTQYYVKWLSDFAKLSDLEKLYKQLCDVMHPAASSVLYQFVPVLGSDGEVIFKPELEADRFHIERTLCEFGNAISRLICFAFDPGLITLRVLHRFALFAQIPELRKFEFKMSVLADEANDLLRK